MSRQSQLYFIALIPPEDLRERVKVLKEEMKDRYGAGHALKSPAHITLQMPFKRRAETESLLVSSLKGFASAQRPFPVALSGFDCFRPRVIYLKVDHHRPIVALHEKLQVFLRKTLGFTEGEVNRRFHPHMTIATRDLRKSAFREAWAEFKNRSFYGAFEAGSIFLLKHNGRFWDIYEEFSFLEEQ